MTTGLKAAIQQKVKNAIKTVHKAT